jgi:glucan phosphoethanolaminetransferase (alkaline phosphatase superfamily)
MLRRYTIEDSQARYLAWGMVLCLFLFEAYVVDVPYSSYFVQLFENETRFFAAVSVIAASLSFYLLYRLTRFSLGAPVLLKVLSITIFNLALLVEYGYQKALGRFSDPADIQTALIATGEQQAASIFMYLNAWALVPGTIAAVLILTLKSRKTADFKDFLRVQLLVITCFALFPFVVVQKFPTLAINAFYRSMVDFALAGPVHSTMAGGGTVSKNLKRRQIPRPAEAGVMRPENNIVVVVDESMRGDHFSLNGYARKTTPLLDDLAAGRILQNWGIAAASSTGSRFSYAALVTGLSPEDFPDVTGIKASTFPTMFQYAKAMNYTTHFFDGQMNSYWGGVEDDKNYLDSWQGILDITEGRSFETWEVDSIIARKVNRIVTASTGNFVFVFKRGAHIPYDTNIPAGEEKWGPTLQGLDKFAIPAGDQLPQAVNAYDNAIRYNIQSFFSNLITDYSKIPNNTVIIYTSDHGQTLFANGRASHGGNTREEALVPLFVIGFPSVLDTTYRASHNNILPTILDLIAYPVELRVHMAAPSLLHATNQNSRQRHFNPDLGQRVAFE